jgi:hypothetical protein
MNDRYHSILVGEEDGVAANVSVRGTRTEYGFLQFLHDIVWRQRLRQAHAHQLRIEGNITIV